MVCEDRQVAPYEVKDIFWDKVEQGLKCRSEDLLSIARDCT